MTPTSTDPLVAVSEAAREHLIPGDPPDLLQTALQWYLNFNFGYPHSTRESNIAVEAFKDGYRKAMHHGQTCGEGWLCPACDLPAHELTQTPGCGAPRFEASISHHAGLREALKHAYLKGATDVHDYWTENPGEAPRGDPEFGEAASDYANAAMDPFDSSAFGPALASPQPPQDEMREAGNDELAELRAFKARVIAAVNFEIAPTPSDGAIAADVAAGMSLRKAAQKHAVGVGVVRGAVSRAALTSQGGEHGK